MDESADLDGGIAYYQLDDASEAVFPPLPVRNQNQDELQDQPEPGTGSAASDMGTFWLL